MSGTTVPRAARRDPARTALLLGALALVVPARARAEASHHQGGSTAQLVPVGLEGLAGAEPLWSLRIFGSFLTADSKLDENGDHVPFTDGSRVTNLAANVLVERRLVGRWTVSALVVGQRLDVASPVAPVTDWGLGDSLLGTRYSFATSWGSIAPTATVKIPGTYPEGEGTGAKQVDVEAKVLAALPRLARGRLGLVAGIGYKLRLGTIEDEVTPTLMLTARPVGALTASALLTGGIALGFGDHPKDTLAPGASIGWSFGPRLDVWAAYYQTVYGHNVAHARVAVLGVGTAM